mmetsp:Transcript_19948/g.60541  ORF Transcript_19948/g.60541 Transcript_19948/m.60541 type:complete len:167 (-) Transcript_19948:157-657(-)
MSDGADNDCGKLLLPVLGVALVLGDMLGVNFASGPRVLGEDVISDFGAGDAGGWMGERVDTLQLAGCVTWPFEVLLACGVWCRFVFGEMLRVTEACACLKPGDVLHGRLGCGEASQLLGAEGVRILTGEEGFEFGESCGEMRSNSSCRPERRTAAEGILTSRIGCD